MYYTYILHCFDGRLYTGYSHDLRQRIQEHKNGKVFSTKNRLPVTLIHYEMFVEESDAKRRELYLKGGNGKKEIEKMLEDYFIQHPWVKGEVIEELDVTPEKPSHAITCGICNGQGKAATKSFFTKDGKRLSGNIEICLTCKGRGWIVPKEMEV